MATNRQIKQALLDKLDVTPQRLSQLVKVRKDELPMSTEQAVYTLAHEHRIDTSRHLTKEETADVRQLVAHLQTAKQTPSGGSKGLPARAKSQLKAVLVTVAGVNVDRLPGMTATHAKEAKVMAEKVYPTLYVFENSARDVISKVLKAGVGDDWWDRVVPQKVRGKAAQRKADEAKDPWHGKRGSALIDYLDLTDLPSIVSAPKAWLHFRSCSLARAGSKS